VADHRPANSSSAAQLATREDATRGSATMLLLAASVAKSESRAGDVLRLELQAKQPQGRVNAASFHLGLQLMKDRQRVFGG
jgi:hypothetical protein